MKTIFRFLATLQLMFLISTSAFATGGAISGGFQQKSSSAIFIDIFGMGPPVDGEAYARVRQTIGELVAEGSVDKFVVFGYGIEGGFGACIELSGWSTLQDLNRILHLFKSIPYDRTTTGYSIREGTQCQQ